MAYRRSRQPYPVLTVTWSLTSQMCNQQTGFRAVEVKSDRRRKWSKSRSLIGRAWCVRFTGILVYEWNSPAGDMLKVCPKFVTSLAGFSPKQTTTINKDSVLQAARQAYAGNMTRKQQKPRFWLLRSKRQIRLSLNYSILEDRAYDKVTVTVECFDGNATSASVEFIGK